MRHRRGNRKLGVKSKHRQALLRNLVRSLVIHKRIRTTLIKAKEASSFADRMVQLAKDDSLHVRRQLISKLGCEDTAYKLVKSIAPRFKDRQGGYTRVLRLTSRPGDNSPMAILEFTEIIDLPKPEKKKKTKAKKESTTAVEMKSAKTSVKEKAKETDVSNADKKESEKKGGFLGALRKFLKGDEK